jgi:HAD superfamily hydrolase (TIGR01509 family)
MAVASGGPAAIVVPYLRATGLLSFDVIVTFDDVGRPKAEPDLFIEAARRLSVPPERCLVFEDSSQDSRPPPEPG